jgi:CBS domain-containing protein
MHQIPSIRSQMTPFPYFVEADDSLLRARSMMVEHRIRHLPVKEHGVLVGVLTDRDLKRVLDPDLGMPPKEELFVNDAFVSEAYCVDGSEPLDRVLDHMATQHIGSALVTKDGQLIGILTATDACRLLRDQLRSLGPRREGDEVA